MKEILSGVKKLGDIQGEGRAGWQMYVNVQECLMTYQSFALCAQFLKSGGSNLLRLSRLSLNSGNGFFCLLLRIICGL
jgi:hypothetical protein